MFHSSYYCCLLLLFVFLYFFFFFYVSLSPSLSLYSIRVVFRVYVYEIFFGVE